MIEYGSFSIPGPHDPTCRDAIHAHVSPTSDAGYFALAAAHPADPTSTATADIVAERTVSDAPCTRFGPGRGAGLNFTIVRGVNGAGYLLEADRVAKARISLAAIRVHPRGEQVEAAGIGDVRVYAYRSNTALGELLLQDTAAADRRRWVFRTSGHCSDRARTLDPDETAAACGLGIYCDRHRIRHTAAARERCRRLVAVSAGVHAVLDAREFDAIATSHTDPADAAQLLVDTAARRATSLGLSTAGRTALVVNVL